MNFSNKSFFFNFYSFYQDTERIMPVKTLTFLIYSSVHAEIPAIPGLSIMTNEHFPMETYVPFELKVLKISLFSDTTHKSKLSWPIFSETLDF